MSESFKGFVMSTAGWDEFVGVVRKSAKLWAKCIVVSSGIGS